MWKFTTIVASNVATMVEGQYRGHFDLLHEGDVEVLVEMGGHASDHVKAETFIGIENMKLVIKPPVEHIARVRVYPKPA